MTARIPPAVRVQVGNLFDETAEDLFQYACTLPNVDRAHAEDLAQMAFYAAALRWNELTVRDLEGRRKWLFTVVKNKAIDTWRKSQRQRPCGDVARSGDPTPEPFNQAMCRIVLRKCWLAIERMPPTRHKVAFLSWNEGWSTREIADWLAIAPATVRGHLKVARDQLVEQVGAEVPFLDDSEDGDIGNGLGGEATS